VACGGFGRLPVRSQVCNRAAVTVPFRWPCRYILYRRSAVHFASISGTSHPPICFGRCSVDTGTRKTVPLQIYHVMAVVSCVYMFGAGMIWAVYQILDRRKVLSYRIRAARQGPRLQARFTRARTFPVNRAQESFIVCSIVPQKVTPIMVTWG